MSNRSKLFMNKSLYDLANTDQMFLDAVKENINFHRRKCSDYDKILKHYFFEIDSLETIDDLVKIPPLPTMYLKNNGLFSIPVKKHLFKATSSGTSGKKSEAGLDLNSSLLALFMVLRTFKFHGVFSLTPTNYIVLGYQPNKNNKLGAAQTAYGTTFATPTLKREYALKYDGKDYRVNFEGIKKALIRYQKRGLPVRFMGFPAYLYFMLDYIEKEGIALNLPKKSMILTAGGWKQFWGEQKDRTELYDLAKKYLGIEESNFRDFYGAVEHPIVYCDCKNHHFHVPIYSRVIIRDVKTLKPVGYGEPGLINLVTPLMKSMPYVSIMTDDIAVMHEGKHCGCGIESPYFEILGRTGMADLKTCAITVDEFLMEVE